MLSSPVTSNRPWIGWIAVAIGSCAVVAAFVASSTRMGQGFTFGFGAFIVFYGLLAVFARNPTPDHWGLVTVGLAMVMVPFLGNGYKADPGASWTCWVAGSLSLVLGGVSWVTDRPPTATGVNEIGAGGQTERSALSFWIGRAALVVGLATVLLGIAVDTTAAGVALTIGLGTLTAIFAVWSLLATDPRHDFLSMAVAGFALFLSPWVAGFAGDGAGWTAWVSGVLVTALGVAGYLRGENLDFGTTVHDNAVSRYRKDYR